MTSWFIDDNVKIIICLHQFLPSLLTHAADLNKNSSKYLLYDIAPGNRVGALTNMFWLLKSVLKVLNWAFTVFFKRTSSQERKHRMHLKYMIYWFSTVNHRLKTFPKPSFEKGEAWFIWAGHWPVCPAWTLTGLAEFKSNYHFCTEPARMFEAIMKRGVQSCWLHSTLDC